MPTGYIIYKLLLVIKWKNVIICCDVYVKYMELILFAQIISHAHKTGRSRFRNPVIHNNKVIIYVSGISWKQLLQLCIFSTQYYFCNQN